MRVLLVTNGLGYGGAERVVEALAKGLMKAGDQVTVVATTRGGPIAESLSAAGVPVEILGIRSRIDVRVPWALVQIGRRFSAEIIHSHLAVADIAVAMAGPFVPRARRFSTVHNTGIELDGYKRTLWHQALRRFDLVMPVGDAVKAALPKSLPLAVVEPSLVSQDAPMLAKAEARARLGIPTDAKLVLAVGRLVPIKGFDVLANATRFLTTPSVRTMVIGDGPDRELLDLQGGLTLAGAREDAAQVLAAADVVVSASRSEGLPQVILQALAYGLPVVATAVGGTTRLVEDGVTGLLVEPESPKALALAIDRLLGDSELGARLGAEARIKISASGLTLEAMVEKVRAVYRAEVAPTRF